MIGPAPKQPNSRTTKPVWKPQPGPQTAAYNCAANVIGYGGAAGGGKSDLMLGFASTRHQRSIIFRRVFPSLRAIIERSREIFKIENFPHSNDSYNESLHRWKLDSGQSLEFAAVQFDKDLKKFQGQPHDFIGIDEATEFPEHFVRFLTGWNRTSDPKQKCRVLLTFNPPMDASGQWVVQFFAPWLDPTYPDPAEDGELRYVARTEDKDVFYRTPEDAPEEARTTLKTRTFFHASIKDNPIYQATGYEATIEALPEPLRSLLKGNFGAVFEDDPYQVIPTKWVIEAQARWREPEEALTLDALGVDVARGGRDFTVIAKRYGTWLAPLVKFPGSGTPNGATAAAQVMLNHAPGATINIDVIGVGSSVYDSLTYQGVDVAGINFAGASSARDKSGRLGFVNVRAESYWKLREMLDPNTGDNIALPPDRELLADLCTPRWELRPGGIKIEDKEEIKKRLGRSPDKADAVVMAFYLGGAAIRIRRL